MSNDGTVLTRRSISGVAGEIITAGFGLTKSGKTISLIQPLPALEIEGQFTSIVTDLPPFIITSDALVNNLNVEFHNGVGISEIQLRAEKDQPLGYAGLDATGVVPLGKLPGTLATDAELTAAISAYNSGTIVPNYPNFGYLIANYPDNGELATALTPYLTISTAAVTYAAIAHSHAGAFAPLNGGGSSDLVNYSDIGTQRLDATSSAFSWSTPMSQGYDAIRGVIGTYPQSLERREVDVAFPLHWIAGGVSGLVNAPAAASPVTIAFNNPNHAIQFNMHAGGVNAYARTAGDYNTCAFYGQAGLTAPVKTGGMWCINTVLEDRGFSSSPFEGGFVINAEFDSNLDHIWNGNLASVGDHESCVWGVDVIGGGKYCGTNFERTITTGPSTLVDVNPAVFIAQRFFGRYIKYSRGFSVRHLRTGDNEVGVGYNSLGQPVLPDNSNGPIVEYRHSVKWDYGYYVDHGAARVALMIGCQAGGPVGQFDGTGVAFGSMPIVFIARGVVQGGIVNPVPASESQIFAHYSHSLCFRSGSGGYLFQSPANGDQLYQGNTVFSIDPSGALFSAAGKYFDIVHPIPEKAEQGYRLRHSAIESPTTGDNLYRYTVQLDSNGNGNVNLPEYFPYLNKDIMVWTSGLSNGIYLAELNQVFVTGNSNAQVNVLVMGTRKDEAVLNGPQDIEYIASPNAIPGILP